MDRKSNEPSRRVALGKSKRIRKSPSPLCFGIESSTAKLEDPRTGVAGSIAVGVVDKLLLLSLPFEFLAIGKGSDTVVMRKKKAKSQAFLSMQRDLEGSNEQSSQSTMQRARKGRGEGESSSSCVEGRTEKQRMVLSSVPRVRASFFFFFSFFFWLALFWFFLWLGFPPIF
jgi:hypothetical protein